MFCTTIVGGGEPSENLVTWAGGPPKMLLERVDKPEKGGLM